MVATYVPLTPFNICLANPANPLTLTPLLLPYQSALDARPWRQLQYMHRLIPSTLALLQPRMLPHLHTGRSGAARCCMQGR
jgi:hypothetical protein